jgi:hypothetical protein
VSFEFSIASKSIGGELSFLGGVLFSLEKVEETSEGFFCRLGDWVISLSSEALNKENS